MPPDLHGQAWWMCVSMACALSGLRCASLVRAAPRGFSARKCATLGCTTLTLSTAAFFACGLSAADAGAASAAWSDLASTRTRPNRAGGPSGFGESTALERSRVRNSSARYSAAIAPLPASSATPRSAGTTFFRTTLASQLAKGSALDIPSARGTVEHSNKREYPSDVGSAGGTHELLLRTPQGQHSLALSLF